MHYVPTAFWTESVVTGWIFGVCVELRVNSYTSARLVGETGLIVKLGPGSKSGSLGTVKYQALSIGQLIYSAI